VFRGLIRASVGFTVLMLFLCVMSDRIWFGSRMLLFEILPLGMCFLSAASIVFVKMWLARWTLVGEGVSVRISSMSLVNRSQLALL